MTPGYRLVALLGVASAAAIGMAAAGLFSPPDDSGQVASTAATTPGNVSTSLDPPVPDRPQSGSAAPTTAAPSTTLDPNAPRALSVLLTGDILTEIPVLETAEEGAAGTGERYDFAPLFAPIRSLIESFDLAVCQMELPIGRPGETPGAQGRSPFGGNRLLAPYEMAPGLAAAGFDRCTTASNHSYDVGDAGIDSTIDALEGVGISWSGTARRPADLPPPVFEVHGVKVAHLSYTRYSNTELPADEWRLAYTENPARVAREVTEARAAGAEIVIVSIHLSKELLDEPLDETRAFTESITASAEIDAVVHHGPHVVQGFETVNGTPVWWTIGNLLSGMARPNPTDRYTDPRTRDGLGAVLRFTESAPGAWETESSSIVLCNESASRVVHAGVSALRDRSLDPAIRDELAGCVERTREAIPDAE